MKRLGIPLILLSEWLFAFVYCVYVLMAAEAKGVIEDTYSPAMIQVFETFVPTLAAMLTFIYMDHASGASRRAPRRIQGIVAVTVCSLFLIAIVGTVFQFSQDTGFTSTKMIERLEWFRLRGMPIIAIIVTYYFMARTKPGSGTAAN